MSERSPSTLMAPKAKPSTMRSFKTLTDILVLEGVKELHIHAVCTHALEVMIGNQQYLCSGGMESLEWIKCLPPLSTS